MALLRGPHTRTRPLTIKPIINQTISSMENFTAVNDAVIKYLRQEQLSSTEQLLVDSLMTNAEGRQLILRFQDPEWVRRQITKVQEQPVTNIWQKVEASLQTQGVWADTTPASATPTVVKLQRPTRRWALGSVVAAAVLVATGSIWYLNRPHTDSNAV